MIKLAGISKLSAERYGAMFAQLTDKSWVFGVIVATVFLVITLCLSYSIIYYVPLYQPTTEPAMAIMTTLKPLMFVFPLITAGLTFAASFRVVKSYLNNKTTALK
jgi:heme/copper-type cytochrome/quinol oxidase subunit 2